LEVGKGVDVDQGQPRSKKEFEHQDRAHGEEEDVLVEVPCFPASADGERKLVKAETIPVVSRGSRRGPNGNHVDLVSVCREDSRFLTNARVVWIFHVRDDRRPLLSSMGGFAGGPLNHRHTRLMAIAAAPEAA